MGRRSRATGLRLEPAEIARFQAHFEPPPYRAPDGGSTRVAAALLAKDRAFARWAEANVVEHKRARLLRSSRSR